MNSIPEPTAQGTVNTVLQLLAQAYADDVILTLFKLQDQCQRWVALSPPHGPAPTGFRLARSQRDPVSSASQSLAYLG